MPEYTQVNIEINRFTNCSEIHFNKNYKINTDIHLFRFTKDKIRYMHK